MSLHCGNHYMQKVASQRFLRPFLSISWKPGWEPVWLRIHLVPLLASSLERNWLGLTKVFNTLIYIKFEWQLRELRVFWCINDHTSNVEDLKNIATIKAKRGAFFFWIYVFFSQGSNSLTGFISPGHFDFSKQKLQLQLVLFLLCFSLFDSFFLSYS